MQGRPLATALVLSLLFAGCMQGVPGRGDSSSRGNPFVVPGEDILVQFDVVSGREPSVFARDALVSVMERVGTNVSTSVRSNLAEKDGYSVEDMWALHETFYPADRHTWRNDEGQAVLHVLYLAGEWLDDPGGTTVGLSFVGLWPLIVLFYDRLPTTSLWFSQVEVPGLSKDGFERSVLIHEYGHSLGLVGCGLPMTKVRHDDADPCHSTEKASVMLAYVHSNEDPALWLRGDDMQPLWQFDEHDWADIRAYQDNL